MTTLIEALALRKCFGRIVAVDDISLRVEKGEVLGFLGPNGAGKSTTMKMITGFLEPDAGIARIAGIDVTSNPKAAKAKLGYLPEGAPAYADMTPRSFLQFIAEIRGFSGSDAKLKADTAAEKTGLLGVWDQRIETLSKGFKRRVGLAQAILHDPPVLIMDEPTDGLDPNQQHHVRGLIRQMAAEKAIIVSTHILQEVEAVCSRAVVIDKGRIVADGTAEDLRRRLPHHDTVAVRVSAGNAEAAQAALASLPAAAGVEIAGKPNGAVVLRVLPKSDQTIGASAASILRERAIDAEEIFIEKGSLDDVFRQITSSEGARRNA
ncbi:MAG: ABC transporter ATP-binding protein [Hyphomicrobiaceae bacterium]